MRFSQYSVIFGSVAMFLAGFDRAHALLRARLADLNDFSAFYRLPAPLAARIRGTVAALWTLHRGAALGPELEQLPGPLRVEVLMHFQAPPTPIPFAPRCVLCFVPRFAPRRAAPVGRARK